MQQDLSKTLFGLLDVLLILRSSVASYIHLMSPVTSGHKDSNITYFDMMIQTPDVNSKGFLYRKDHQEKSKKVEENDSPIEMKNIKEK